MSSMTHLMFRGIATAKYGVPLALAAIAGCGWWGFQAWKLADQLERHAPAELGLTHAVRASKDGEVYARIGDATLDCTKGLFAKDVHAYALVDGNGMIPAMVQLPGCSTSTVFEGVFLDPPNGLYGEAVSRGWSVTSGHLAFLDPKVTSSHAWFRLGVAAFIALMLGAYLFAVLRAERSRDRAWSLRAIGLAFFAALPWLAYMAHDYAVWGVIPVPLLAACGAVSALAMITLARTPYGRNLADRFLG